jgi:hypothetical protein
MEYKSHAFIGIHCEFYWSTTLTSLKSTSDSEDLFLYLSPCVCARNNAAFITVDHDSERALRSLIFSQQCIKKKTYTYTHLCVTYAVRAVLHDVFAIIQFFAQFCVLRRLALHTYTQEQGASGSGTSLNAGVHISAGRIYRTECFNKHNRVAICSIAVHKNNDLGGDDLTFPLAGCRIKRSCAGVMKCSYESCSSK